MQWCSQTWSSRSPPVFYRTSSPLGRRPTNHHLRSHSHKAGQRVSLTTYCPWATGFFSSFFFSFLSLTFIRSLHLSFVNESSYFFPTVPNQTNPVSILDCFYNVSWLWSRRRRWRGTSRRAQSVYETEWPSRVPPRYEPQRRWKRGLRNRRWAFSTCVLIWFPVSEFDGFTSDSGKRTSDQRRVRQHFQLKVGQTDRGTDLILWNNLWTSCLSPRFFSNVQKYYKRDEKPV